jgi:hypothetical protein
VDWVFLGAILTILSLAKDPFAQQVLSVPQQAVPMELNTASISYNHHYENNATHKIRGSTCKLF